MGIRKSSSQSGPNNIGGVAKTGSLPPGAPHHGCALNTQSFFVFSSTLRTRHILYIYTYTYKTYVHIYVIQQYILYNNVNLPPPPPPRRRLRGDATPRTLVGVSEAQKKGQVKRLSARQRGTTKDQTSGFFVSFVRDFRNFSHQPSPHTPLTNTALAVAADLNLCISFYTAAATTFDVLFYLYLPIYRYLYL